MTTRHLLLTSWLRTPARPAPARARLRLVGLEDRLTPTTVDTLLDVVDANDKLTSLREAVAAFNADPDDFQSNTITFDSKLKSPTFVLTAGELAVTGKAGTANKLTLTNNLDTPVTISGGGASRLFNVSAGVDLTLDGGANGAGGLVLTAGSATKGGAVLSAGTVTLSSATVTGNQATEGGGVYNNAGTITVTGSVLSNNQATAGDGGGLRDAGGVSVTIRSTLVRGNTATGNGGGLRVGKAEVYNVTISGNKADGSGGGVWANGQLSATHVTAVLNVADADGNAAGAGGGVFIDAAGTAILNNTLVGGNTVGTGTTAGDIGGTITGAATSNSNFVADPASSGTLADGTNGNVVGNGGAAVDIATVIDVTLAANGGTGPLTHALDAAGPAVDAGDKTFSLVPLTTTKIGSDQRGTFTGTAGVTIARVAGADVDIGAFELQNLPPAVTGPTVKAALVEDGTGITFTGAGNTFAVTDDNFDAPSYTVTAKAAGNLTFATTAGLTALTGNGTPTVTFKAATLTAVNDALGSLSYALNPNQYGVDTIDVTVSDGEAAAAGGERAGSFSYSVPVDARIDPPTVTSPATAPGTPVLVTFTRNPVDGGEVAYFKVTNLKGGTLSYVDPDGKTVAVTPGATTPFSGSFFDLKANAATKLTFTPAAGFVGAASFDIQAAIGEYSSAPTTPPVFGGPVLTSTVTVTAGQDPTLVGYPQFAAGGDKGNGTAALYNPDQSVRFTATPFAGFTGGVRTASGDFNGDGVGDLAVGTGPGRATRVVVIDGATQKELFAIDPFEASFTGGLYVAAGDVTGDGLADLLITPDQGGGPRVRIFNGNGFAQVADFFGIQDKTFFGGARAAVADINGDGFGDLLVAAGFSGGPRVAAFDGSKLTPTGGPKLFGDFFAFESTLTNGVFIAGGDVNGDGFADVVVGGGPNGGPRVSAFDGAELINTGKQTRFVNFFAGPDGNRGGIRVAVKDIDGDAQADVVVGSGTGNGSKVTAYAGAGIEADGTRKALFAFDAIAGFTGGVFVG